MTTIDMEKYHSLCESVMGLRNITRDLQKRLECTEAEIKNTQKEIKKMLPNGYWYTYDIDERWNYPKKYSVKEVSCYEGYTTYVKVKESVKKKPWPGFSGEHIYRMEEFLNLSIHKTEEEATEARKKRICPKCGGYMGLVITKWCANCMAKRRQLMYEFDESHKFYDPVRDRVYHVKYDDEFTTVRGFNGASFTIRRKDTGEIIHTRNLWSHGTGNSDNLPEIEFLSEE